MKNSMMRNIKEIYEWSKITHENIQDFYENVKSNTNYLDDYYTSNVVDEEIDFVYLDEEFEFDE